MSKDDTLRRCFVVAPLGAPGSQVRRRADNVIDHIIRPAAAAVEPPLDVVRADQLGPDESVTLQIVESILAADLLVCDLTGANPNVLYELVLAEASGKAIVAIAEEGTSLPFDLAGRRTIFIASIDLTSVSSAIPSLTRAMTEALADPGAGSPIRRAAQLKALADPPAAPRTPRVRSTISASESDVISFRLPFATPLGLGALATAHVTLTRAYQALAVHDRALGDAVTAALSSTPVGAQPLPRPLATSYDGLPPDYGDLTLIRIVAQSKGFQDLAGVGQAAEQLRGYLTDRHERKKDSSWRDAQEQEAASIDIELRRVELARLRAQTEREQLAAAEQRFELASKILGLDEARRRAVRELEATGPAIDAASMGPVEQLPPGAV